MYSFRVFRQRAAPVSKNLCFRNFATIPTQKLAFRSINVFNSTKLESYYNRSERRYSILTTPSEAKLYDYKDVKDVVDHPAKHPDSVLVDVREPVEFHDGHIPGALNIPFKSSPGALDLSPEEFEDNFGFDKPSKEKELIFYCLGGVRSTAAEELAKTFGYKNRGNYVGSYEDWASKENAKGESKPVS
ncbi:uncharacterized protein PRCAT00000466001 [Priceomyces carsonii]|uniref:uncharacterized protein n=1 Tax=Priceomyces carsonii TaxID=28549 RepID=UPI002EDB3245|nr:unnamed protein product [Priceomyces carsonii]